MGILIHLILGVIHLVLVVLDVLILVIAVEIAHRCWPSTSWLVRLHASVLPTVELLIRACDRAFGKLFSGRLTRAKKAILCLVALMFARMFLYQVL